MTKKNIAFHFLFLFLVSIWIATILSTILNYSPTNQIASSSFLASNFALFYWLIAGVSAATSFTLGLDKLGIVEDLRVKIFGEDEGYEPSVHVSLPETPSEMSTLQSTVEEQFSTEESGSVALVAKVNSIIEREEKRKNPKKQKAFYLFGETDFKKCPHKFGFLGKSLTDKPIPDECFGCYRIIECFNKSGKPKKNKKPELSTVL
jgi:hypothetical protein